MKKILIITMTMLSINACSYAGQLSTTARRLAPVAKNIAAHATGSLASGPYGNEFEGNGHPQPTSRVQRRGCATVATGDNEDTRDFTKAAQRFNDYNGHYQTMHYQRHTPSAYHVGESTDPLTPQQENIFDEIRKAQSYQACYSSRGWTETAYHSIPQDQINKQALAFAKEKTRIQPPHDFATEDYPAQDGFNPAEIIRKNCISTVFENLKKSGFQTK